MTHTKDEALKLALEALSSIDIYLSDTLSGRVNPEPATYKQWLIDGIIEARKRSRAAITAITAIKQALSAPVQEPVVNASAWFALVMNAAAELEDASHCLRDEDAKRVAISGAKHYRDAAKALYTIPPAARPAPDLQAELDATNRQVEILSDALAESRREVAALKAVQEPVAWVNHGENKITRATGWDGYGALYTTPPAAQPAVPLTDDTRRLDALAENSWDLRCFDMSDDDIGWRVIEHHMSKPHERTVAEVFRDDPRQAIDAAIEAAHGITEKGQP
jgi:hypothetical protein